MAYAKGAPEVIVQSCLRLLTEKGEEPLDDVRREQSSRTGSRNGR